MIVPGRSGPYDAQRTARALGVWTGAALSTPAELHLIEPAWLGLAASPALRYRADVPHPEESGRRAAMVALVVDVIGAPIAAHRTFITRDSRKASIAGGAIRLHPVAAELMVGEGIKTSASAGQLLGLPAWAAVAAGTWRAAWCCATWCARW